MRRPRVLILGFASVAGNPRQLKQVDLLRDDMDVTTSSPGEGARPGVPHISLELGELRRRGVYRIPGVPTLVWHCGLHWLRARWLPEVRAAYDQIQDRDWDLIVVHDLEAYPVAERIGARHGILLDLHEYSPAQYEHKPGWTKLYRPYIEWLIRRAARRRIPAVTVGAGIAKAYQEHYGLLAEVVVNATPYHRLTPGPTARPLRLVHSGVAAPQRDTRALVDAIEQTSADVTLDLLLVSDGSDYLDRLRASVEGSDRVRVLEPVPYTDLVDTLNGYDIGIHILPPVNFNNLWALPNKFFDYVQARLAVVIGPSPEMRRVLDAHGLGAVTDDFEPASLSRLLEALTPAQIDIWKAAADAAASRLSSEAEWAKWRTIVDRILAAPSRHA